MEVMARVPAMAAEVEQRAVAKEELLEDFLQAEVAVVEISAEAHTRQTLKSKSPAA